jgi:hypothetical protein
LPAASFLPPHSPSAIYSVIFVGIQPQDTYENQPVVSEDRPRVRFGSGSREHGQLRARGASPRGHQEQRLRQHDQLRYRCDQLEPRTPISSLPFTIAAAGSDYLTGNLTAAPAAPAAARLVRGRILLFGELTHLTAEK